MARDFNEAILQIADARRTKNGYSVSIYDERESIKRNQYLLDDALAHSQDGSTYQRNISTSRKNISGLIPQFQEAVNVEKSLVMELQDGYGGYEGLVNQLNDRYPILFFPLRIETTFNDSMAIMSFGCGYFLMILPWTLMSPGLPKAR